MLLNLSARKFDLVIADLNCTSALVSADGGYSHYDQSGLALIEASFVLKRVFGFTENFDDRVNSRWARGKVINLKIFDSNGELRNAPVIGHTRILNAEYDGISELKIEAGCILNLLNFRTPLGDGACFDLGTETSLNAIAIKLLQKAGISGFLGSITGSPLAVPLPKLSNESYVQLFGKLCWANGCIAYQDNLGVVKVKNVSLFPTPIHTKAVGFDDAKYDRLTGAEKPCEKIRVTGVINRVRPTKPFTITVNTEYGPISAIDPRANSSKITILSQTTIRERLEFGSRKRTTITEKYEPLGKILPTRFPGRIDLFLSQKTEETSFYETQQDYTNIGEDSCNDPDEGKLTKIESIVSRPFGAALLEWLAANPRINISGILNFIVARQDTTTYRYKFIKEEFDLQSTVIPTITTITELLAGAILPNDFFDNGPIYVADLVISEKKYQTWEELRPEEWRYTESLDQNLATGFPEALNPPLKEDQKIFISVATKLLLINVSSKSITSNSGQATPPAPDRFPPTHSIKQEQVKIEVNIPASFGSQFRAREREFSVDSGLLTSKTQAENIGRIEGHILWGRYKGQSIAIALGDELFSISPLVGSVWTDLSGSRHLFMVDGFSVALANNRFAAQFDGIWCGAIAPGVAIAPNEPIPPGAISPPYMLIEDVEIGSGWGFEVQDYPYSIEPVFLDVGFGSGSGFAVLIPADYSSIRVGSGLGFAILDDADIVRVDIGIGSRTEIYEKQETPIVFGTGSGFRVQNGLINEKSVAIGTGFRFDVSPALFLSKSSGFNVRSFSGIDPESSVIAFASGKGFDIENVLISDVEIANSTGFTVRSFTGLDSESDVASFGSGKGFGVENALQSIIEIGKGNGFDVDSFAGIEEDASDTVNLGIGSGFDAQEALESVIQIGKGNGFDAATFAGLEEDESDTVNLGVGSGFDVKDTLQSSIEIGLGVGFNIRSFSGIDPESDAVSIGEGFGTDINFVSSELITHDGSFLVDSSGNRLYAAVLDLSYLNLEPEVVDYKNRIAISGGSISSADLIAHNLLLKELKYTGLWSKIKELYTFAGEDLTTALCKFKYISQPNLVNVGFTSANYSKFFGMSGLANGYLRTGVIPNNSFVDGDIHVALQVQMIGSSSSWYCASYVSNSFALGFQRSSFVHRVYTGILSASPTRYADTVGFIGFTRMGTSNLIKIFGRSQLFTTAPSTPPIASALPNLDMALFARNNNGVFDLLSRDAIACFSVGTGLTTDELDTLENIIKTFKIGIGR